MGFQVHFQNSKLVTIAVESDFHWVQLSSLICFYRRGHTMTTIEGQLAVLGGAATRPQGDTEVIHCLYYVS